MPTMMMMMDLRKVRIWPPGRFDTDAWTALTPWKLVGGWWWQMGPFKTLWPAGWPAPARWSMSSRLRHQPWSWWWQRWYQYCTMCFQWSVSPKGSPRNKFSVKVGNLAQPAWPHNIGWDEILGSIEGGQDTAAIRVTAGALQRLLTMVQKSALVVQYSDRPFYTIGAKFGPSVERF